MDAKEYARYREALARLDKTIVHCDICGLKWHSWQLMTCSGCAQQVCCDCREWTTWYGGDAQWVCQQCLAGDVDPIQR